MGAYMKDQSDNKADELVAQQPDMDTEDDMEAFFKQQKMKVTRKNTGIPDNKHKKKEPAPEATLVQQFPEWISNEKDLEQYLAGKKVIRRDTGNGGVNPSGNKPIEPEPTALTSLVQLPSKYRKETDKKDPLAWANLDQVSEKPAQDLVHNTMTDDIAESQKHDLHTPKDNSWDSSAILGGEQKRIDASERRHLIQENYDNEDGELIQELP